MWHGASSQHSAFGGYLFGVPGVHMGQVSSLVPVFRHDSSDVNDVRFRWSNMLQKLVVLGRWGVVDTPTMTF